MRKFWVLTKGNITSYSNTALTLPQTIELYRLGWSVELRRYT